MNFLKKSREFSDSVTYRRKMSFNLRNRKIENLLVAMCEMKMKLPTLPVEMWETSISWMTKALVLVIKYSCAECKGDNFKGALKLVYARVRVFAPESEEADILDLLFSKEGPARERLLREMATGWLS